MATKHSNKALQTLTLMNTTPEQWKHVDILFERRTMKVPGKVTCPTCDGLRWVQLDSEGQVVPPPAKDTGVSSYHARSEYARAAEAVDAADRRATGASWLRHGNCPTCRVTSPRSRDYGRSTGSVVGPVEQEVLLAIPLWPAGTAFDSRFRSGCSCQLCGKTVTKSRLVPVVGVDNAGAPHGMWVGSDCAKRFLPGVITYSRQKDRPADAKHLDLVYDGADADAEG